jgi:DnaJ-class molecular chaperone
MPKKPPPPKPKRCSACSGSGTQYAYIDGRLVPVTCTVCKGTGRA